MNQEDLKTLVEIYNTLLLVSTSGEDTMIMGDCLKAFKSFLVPHIDKNNKGGLSNE